MRRYGEDEVVDAVVIGTGAGGAPLLWRLAAAGLKVVALEAGKWWHPAEDFAADEQYQRFLFWNEERLSAGGNPLAFGNNNSGTGVGGTTLHYTAFTPRAHPDDFRLHTEFGVGRDWPLGYEDLEPYYNEVESILGVSGPEEYPWGPPRQYPLAPLPLNGPAQLMQQGCEALGIRTSPAPNAALSAPYFVPGLGWRAPCANRGFCQAGCTVGAKASMDVTFIPLAAAAGAEIRPECFVTHIETQAGRVTGVVYSHEGQEHQQKCRALFLCAGAIETPRLLMLNRLALDSGQVGQNFMAHPGVQVWGEFEPEIRPWKGIPASLISEDTHRPQTRWPEADFAGGYLLQSIGAMPVTYASQYARGQQRFGAELRDHLQRYNHFAGIDILGECLPYPKNFMELSEETDERGLPKPRVHFTAGENEERLAAHGEALMRAIWDAADGKNLWAFPRFAHIIGTCRMGLETSDSVANPNGCSHEIPNLYICDNSVFPSALSVNPSLTIMALSLRTADNFLHQ
jgi:choline dehydrogenase-like flavoprotein